jgi:hypothetical protein
VGVVGGEQRITRSRPNLVILAVLFAQVSPIATLVAREKLGRSLPGLSQGRERAGRGDDLPKGKEVVLRFVPWARTPFGRLCDFLL